MEDNKITDAVETGKEKANEALAEVAEAGKGLLSGAKDIFGKVKDQVVDAAETVVKKDLDGDGKIGGDKAE